MGKNKIIFIAIILGIAILLIIFLNFFSGTSQTNEAEGDLVVRTYNLGGMNKVIDGFKEANGSKNAKIVVKNFENYYDYKLALNVAFLNGSGPDVFLLNNFEIESSIFDGKISGLHPDEYNPSEFENKYKPVFSKDLITTSSSDGKRFVIGIPVGYETLGIYYNVTRVTDPKSLSSWDSIGNELERLKEEGIENPLGVYNNNGSDISADVLSQFFILTNNKSNFSDMTNVGNAFNNYYEYISVNSDNSVSNGQYVDEKNIELFENGEEAMIIGYPSMVNELSRLKFGNSNLRVAPFPCKGDRLVRYSYFVINNKPKNRNLALSFLAYLDSEKGATTFLNQFTYLIPAQASLEKDYLKKNISNDYSAVTLSNFVDDRDLNSLTSFGKVIVETYDKELNRIIKNKINYTKETENLRKTLDCKFDKINYFVNELSKDLPTKNCEQ